jgi:uncharacterized protein (DUF2336 family)
MSLEPPFLSNPTGFGALSCGEEAWASAMQTNIATAAAADPARLSPGEAEGEAVTVTAEAFRQLTARLRARRSLPPPPPQALAALPEPAPQPAPEPVLDLPVPRRERTPGDEAGDTAIILLELMAAATGLQPQERALAADTLLLLLPRMPSQQLVRLAERVAIMDNPPPLLVAKLIRDPRPEVMAPVLERNAHVSDLDIIEQAGTEDAERLRMIARRRALSPVLSAHVVSCGDPVAILALLRNPGAQLPHQSFARLAQLAAEHPALLAPLVTRAELPAARAFELFWSLPPELRRLILSRFLTDSIVLGKILRIALAEDRSTTAAPARAEGAVAGEALDVAFEMALAAAAAQRKEEAALRFAELAGVAEATALRILNDPYGEPIAVLFKALGLSRGRFVEAMDRLRTGGEQPDWPDSGELQAVFDALSFNKARMLLGYWDWFSWKTGPYAPRS